LAGGQSASSGVGAAPGEPAGAAAAAPAGVRSGLGPKPKLLLICHLPPPVHGASLVGSLVTGSLRLRAEYDIETIPIQLNSVNLKSIAHLSGGKVVKSAAIAVKMARSLVQRRPVLIYMTLSISGLAFARDLVLATLAKLANVRVVFHLHMRGVESRYRSSLIYRLAYRWAFAGADVLHLSEGMFGDVACVVPRERFHVVENGVADPAGLRRPEAAPAEPRILFLSNLFIDKGPLDLLHACQQLWRSGETFRLTFIGAAADAAVTDEIGAAQQDPAQNAEWLGPVYGDQKFEVLGSATLFAFPSYYRYEVQPLSVIEAMALSVPVIASNIAALPDMIDDGVEGLLVAPRDIVGLAGAIRRLLGDETLRRDMGLAARRRYLAQFTLAAFEARLTDAISAIVAREAARKAHA
jgi:glycosyltransferase involved in cell wall biosynthesis